MAKKCVAEKRTSELRLEKSGNPSPGERALGKLSTGWGRTGEGPRRQGACLSGSSRDPGVCGRNEKRAVGEVLREGHGGPPRLWEDVGFVLSDMGGP